MSDIALSQITSKPFLLKSDASPIFIYGTGTFARDLLDIFIRHDLPVSGFLDPIPHQPDVHGLPVLASDALPTEARTRARVIIGIHNREANIARIIHHLKTLGYAQIFTPIDLYDEFAAELGTRYWLTPRTYYSSFASEIQAVSDLLSDERSRGVWASLLRFRITGDYSLLPEPDMEHQYFPPDLPAWPNPIRFVDCGAYTGDTLQALLKSGYEFESVAAFEPDQSNFRKLTAYVTQNAERFLNSVLFPCGVYSSTTQLTFETGKGEASLVSESGSNIIQCISLDECIPTFQPTLIKMDIEGAEIEALHGAERIIKQYQPALAISVYHTPAHIWEIPLLFDKLAQENDLRYTYYLRPHGFNCFDTIFYAIPSHSRSAQAIRSNTHPNRIRIEEQYND